MRLVKKLMAVLILAGMILPATLVSAASTTFQVNNGATMYLEQGASIAADSATGIPVAVRGLPDLGTGNGLAGFNIALSWDSRVLRVDGVRKSTEAFYGEWNLTVGEIDNVDGHVIMTGYTTTYSTEDVVLYNLAVTAVGEPGASTAINVVVFELIDANSDPIPVTPVGSVIRIEGEEYITIIPTDPTILEGETQQLIAEHVDSKGVKTDVTSAATWSSSNPSVATIQTAGSASPGLASGIKEGPSTISVQYNGVLSSVLVTVTPVEEDPAPVDEPVDQPVDEPVDQPVDQPVDNQDPAIDQTPTDDTTTQPEQPSQNDTGVVTEDADPDDGSGGSGLTIIWIVGGVVVFGGVIATIWYTMFSRRRY